MTRFTLSTSDQSILGLDNEGNVGKLGLARSLCHPSTIGVVTVSFLLFSLLACLRGPLASLGYASYPSMLLVGLVGGVIAASGGLIGYLLGTRTDQDIQKEHIYARSLALTRRWLGPSLFTFAILPGPFMMVSLWAGTVHYPMWRFLLYVTAGKVIKLTGFAFVGYHSLPWLLRPLG